MENFALNISILNFLNRLANSSLYASNLAIFFAVYLGWLSVLILVIYVWGRHRRFWRRFRLALFSLAAGLLALYFADLIKSIWPIARPTELVGIKALFVPGDPGSFPSSHAAFFGGMAFYLLFRNVYYGGYLAAIALLVGVGRVAVGAHYPLDVAAGWLVGLIAALAFLWVGDRIATA